MRKGPAGTTALNPMLQALLNPPAPGKAELARHQGQAGAPAAPAAPARVFRVGDRVIQQVNNYDKEVFNGDQGRVRGRRRWRPTAVCPPAGLHTLRGQPATRHQAGRAGESTVHAAQSKPHPGGRAPPSYTATDMAVLAPDTRRAAAQVVECYPAERRLVVHFSHLDGTESGPDGRPAGLREYQVGASAACGQLRWGGRLEGCQPGAGTGYGKPGAALLHGAQLTPLASCCGPASCPQHSCCLKGHFPQRLCQTVPRPDSCTLPSAVVRCLWGALSWGSCS